MVRPALLLLLLALPLAASCGDDDTDPLIEALLPDHGKPGDTVELVGERMDGLQRQVSFGGEAAVVLTWQDRRARVQVPERPGGWTTVVVTVDGRPSNAVGFWVD
jgi:hypothetical protein